MPHSRDTPRRGQWTRDSMELMHQPLESGVWFGPERQREGDDRMKGHSRNQQEEIGLGGGSSAQLFGAARSQKVRTPSQHPEFQCLQVTPCCLHVKKNGGELEVDWRGEGGLRTRDGDPGALSGSGPHPASLLPLAPRVGERGRLRGSLQ